MFKSSDINLHKLSVHKQETKTKTRRAKKKKLFGRLFLSDFFSRSLALFLHNFWILVCSSLGSTAPWPSLSSLSSSSTAAAVASKTATRRTKTTIAKWLLFYQKLKILRVRCILFLRRAHALTHTQTVEGECNEVYCCQTRFSDSYQHQPGNIMCIYKLDFLSRVLARAWESCSFCEIAKNSMRRSQLVSQMRDELNRRRELLVRMNSVSFFSFFLFSSVPIYCRFYLRAMRMPTN